MASIRIMASILTLLLRITSQFLSVLKHKKRGKNVLLVFLLRVKRRGRRFYLKMYSIFMFVSQRSKSGQRHQHAFSTVNCCLRSTLLSKCFFQEINK